MKYYKFLLFAVVIFAATACEKIDSEPPRSEGTFTKRYKMPDPTQLTTEQSILLKEIQNEYANAIKNAN